MSEHSDQLMKLFHGTCEKHGILHDPDECFRYIAEFPEQNGQQLSLFDETSTAAEM